MDKGLVGTKIKLLSFILTTQTIIKVLKKDIASK
jgi:hypothetical protein